MASVSIQVLGTDLVFTTDASPGEVKKAKKLVEDKYDNLDLESFHLSIGREKLMLSLALSLADDLVKTNEKLEQILRLLEEYNQQ